MKGGHGSPSRRGTIVSDGVGRASQASEITPARSFSTQQQVEGSHSPFTAVNVPIIAPLFPRLIDDEQEDMDLTTSVPNSHNTTWTNPTEKDKL